MPRAESKETVINKIKREESLTTIEIAVGNYKRQLDLLGIKYPKDATIDTLVALKEAADAISKVSKESAEVNVGADSIREMETPVRIRLVCNNPAKRAHKGEFFGVGNSFGAIRAFIPYNCSTAEDMRIPKGLIEVLKHREYLHVRELTEKERRESGSSVMHVTSYTKEFTVIEL